MDGHEWIWVESNCLRGQAGQFCSYRFVYVFAVIRVETSCPPSRKSWRCNVRARVGGEGSGHLAEAGAHAAIPVITTAGVPVRGAVSRSDLPAAAAAAAAAACAAWLLRVLRCLCSCRGGCHGLADSLLCPLRKRDWGALCIAKTHNSGSFMIV